MGGPENADFGELATGTVALAVIVGLVGVATLYSSVLQRRTAGSIGDKEKEIVKQGKLHCKVGRVHELVLSQDEASKKQEGENGDAVQAAVQAGAIESTSDFLRNLGSIFVSRHSSEELVALSFLAPGLGEIVNSGAPCSKKTVIDVCHEVACVLRQSLGEQNADLSDVAGLVVEILTVTPSMECLLHAGIMPPAMYQPRYTLSISRSGQIRCITDGFVGSNVQGPSHPDKKYTDMRMRLVSDDIRASAKISTLKTRIDYCVQHTSDVNCADVIRGAGEAVRQAVRSSLERDDPAQEKFWQGVLLC